MTDNGPRRRVRSHGVSGYRAGCRCLTCVAAETNRKRNYRTVGSGARSNFTKKGDVERNSVIGEAEAAVIQECESLPLAAERPVSVVGARLAARILDNPDMSLQHGKAAALMRQWMAQLYPQQKPVKTGRRLATVQALTTKVST